MHFALKAWDAIDYRRKTTTNKQRESECTAM